MQSRSRSHNKRPRGAPPLPSNPDGHHARQPPTPRTRRSPSNPSYAEFPAEDDAVSTLMDIDGSPLNGAGFLDEDDGEVELFAGPSRDGGRGGIAMDPPRAPPFTGFFNSFDGADFDDADLD